MSLLLTGTEYLSASGMPGGTGGGARTIAMWVRTTNTAAGQFFFTIGDESGTNTFLAGVIVSNKFRTDVLNQQLDGATTISANTWYHFAVVYNPLDALRIRMYVNGTQDGTLGGFNLNIQGSIFYQGRHPSRTDLNLNGMMAEFCQWTTPLTATDIGSLADGFSPNMVEPRHIVYYTPLVRDFTDYKGFSVSNVGSAGVGNHPRIY